MEQNGKGWFVWLLVVPVAVAAGAFMTKWAMHGHKPQAPTSAEAPAAPQPAPAPAPQPAGSPDYDLPGDEPEAQEALISWGKTAPGDGGAASVGRPAAGGPAGPATVSPEEAKKNFGMGAAYGALTKAADVLVDNPKALAALFNNDYVVKGFMSRDTVKKATASSASLAAYLKNPANLSSFMAKSPVQRGMNDREAVNAVASSKLVGAMLDTPGGKELLKDPMALAGVLQANPELVNVLTNPAIMTALAGNPRTSALVTQLTLSSVGR